MPGGKVPIPGGSAKDQDQYEVVKSKLQGEKNPRAKEIAARVVNARRSKEGRTKEDKD